MTTRQLALDLEHRPALGADDFLVAASNADAVDWIDRFPEWPSPVLTIAGPAGAGKTHLTKVFLSISGAEEIILDETAELASEWPDAPAIAIDGADRVCGNAASEESLFHLYNDALSSGRRILLTAASPPARWPINLPDLASRLRASAVATIGPPDDSLLITVMAKQFADRQMNVDDDVLRYAATRLERSFSAVRRFVTAIDKYSMESKRRVTVPLARDVLSSYLD